MRHFRPVFLKRWLYPEAIFRIRTTEKVLYLTFDDGPDPVSTPQLLSILKAHNIKAIFFCTGKRAEEYSDLMNEIRAGGYMIGNHGYNHYNGWRTDSLKYINDIIRASDFTSDRIFRPPFGRLSIKQKKGLPKSFKLIFWDIMAYDFDFTFGASNSLRILKTRIRPGSIIVLHDTVTSCANAIIGEFLTYAIRAGYRFELLEDAERK
jgi:peptidoglycan/xylan/chitin deacetylase (PgdA/CDA1 family)